MRCERAPCRNPRRRRVPVEYSVRAAQMAVYQLIKIDRQVPQVTRHDKSLAVIFATLEKVLA